MLFHTLCATAMAAMVATSQLATAAAQSSSSVRGAAINSQHHHNCLRALQEEEQFTFLIADIQYEDGVTAASHKLQGNSNRNKPERTINLEDSSGIICEIEEGSGSVEGIQSGVTVQLPPTASLNAQGRVDLNGGALTKKKKSNNKRDLQEDDSSTELRRHLATTGTKTVVAVKVVAAGNVAYDFSEAELSNKVFGTSGDTFNLKKGYEQCSHGQLTITPGGSAYNIVNGVTTITVATDVAEGNAVMVNAVTATINAKFGVSQPTA